MQTAPSMRDNILSLIEGAVCIVGHWRVSTNISQEVVGHRRVSTAFSQEVVGHWRVSTNIFHEVVGHWRVSHGRLRVSQAVVNHWMKDRL